MFLKGWLYGSTAALVLLSAHASPPALATSPSPDPATPALSATVSADSLWRLPLRCGNELGVSPSCSRQ